jgi:hypothetical protein
VRYIYETFSVSEVKGAVNHMLAARAARQEKRDKALFNLEGLTQELKSIFETAQVAAKGVKETLLDAKFYQSRGRHMLMDYAKVTQMLQRCADAEGSVLQLLQSFSATGMSELVLMLFMFSTTLTSDSQQVQSVAKGAKTGSFIDQVVFFSLQFYTRVQLLAKDQIKQARAAGMSGVPLKQLEAWHRLWQLVASAMEHLVSLTPSGACEKRTKETLFGSKASLVCGVGKDDGAIQPRGAKVQSNKGTECAGCLECVNPADELDATKYTCVTQRKKHCECKEVPYEEEDDIAVGNAFVPSAMHVRYHTLVRVVLPFLGSIDRGIPGVKEMVLRERTKIMTYVTTEYRFSERQKAYINDRLRIL